MAERPRKVLTLCLVKDGARLLLGMKKRGFGAGWWNGFGGKVQKEETVEGAAKREAFEEAGITVESMEKVGIIEFEFVGKDEILQVHIFRVDRFSGEPTESEEMEPKWFDVAEIPFEKMWPSDRVWLPLFLGDKKFRGRVQFSEKNEPLHNEITEVHEI